ncbi:MAG: DUF1566 domain-containing protein [bacterium]|nr:DUF1566 domain-containing protein [bacterium]
MNKHRLVKSEFETMKQFNTRSAGCRMKMKTLEFGYRSALADINYRFNTHYKSQLERYRQRADEFKALKYITTGLKLKLLRYNAERSYYYINIYDTTGKCRKFKLTIKPEKAKAIHDRQHQLRVVCNYLKPGGWDELKVSAILDPVFKRLTQLKNIDVRSKSIQCYNDPEELVQIAENDIVVKEMGAARVIFDYGTGLAWHGVKTTSEQTKHWERFLGKLNREKYGGFTKWRLPTLAEIGSLYSLNTGGRKLFPDYQDIKAADKLNSSNYWIVTLWKKYMVADRYTFGYLILPVCSMD